MHPCQVKLSTAQPEDVETFLSDRNIDTGVRPLLPELFFIDGAPLPRLPLHI